MKKGAPGLAAATAIAALVILIQASIPLLSSVSPLLISISIGIVVCHLIPGKYKPVLQPGLNTAKGIVLRTAIVLYGFNISFQSLTDIGFHGILVATVLVFTVLIGGTWLGTRIFGLDFEQSILVSAGSAICGAAAVAACEPVIKAAPQKVLTAISTVVVFGTISMLLMPLTFSALNLSELDYGLWVGVTVHEVAQVVVAADAIGDVSAHVAVLEKMFRVMLLLPALLVIMVWVKHRAGKNGAQQASKNIALPWFAFLFIGAIAIHSVPGFPIELAGWLSSISTFLLCVAMSALGLLTHISVIRQGGARAFGLAGVLFIVLQTLGYGLVVLL